MTREEIRQLNPVEPYCFHTDDEERWYEIGLVEGAKIADAAMIEKACEWLKVFLDTHYVMRYRDSCEIAHDIILEGFRGAMEE